MALEQTRDAAPAKLVYVHSATATRACTTRIAYKSIYGYHLANLLKEVSSKGYIPGISF
jgi:hypothetical protein